MTLQSWVAAAGCILLAAFFGLITIFSGISALVPGSGDLRGPSLVIAIVALVLTLGFGILAHEAMFTNPDDDDD